MWRRFYQQGRQPGWHTVTVINMYLKREGFQATPHIIKFQQQNMMVVVEGKRLLCWSCKQLGHFTRSYPQKTVTPTKPITTAATSGTSKELEPGGYSNKEEGLTQVSQKGRKNNSPLKQTAAETTTIPTTKETTTTPTKTK